MRTLLSKKNTTLRSVLHILLCLSLIFSSFVFSFISQNVYAAAMISNLVVNDSSNAADWSVQTNLQVGNLIFGDRDFTFLTIPSSVTGCEWIRSANDSKSYTGTTLVSFTLGSNADVYVAHNDAITSKPSWLSGWADTGENITAGDFGGATATYSLYKKTYSSGSSVSVGQNGGTNSMYTIIVKATSTPTPTPTPTSGIITGMTVNDSSNSADWSIQSNIQVNNTQYGDRTYMLATVPSSVAGSAWIRTANDSKTYTGSTLVTFTVTQNADVYVAHADEIPTKPSWLSSWTDTGDNIVNDYNGGVSYSLFKKYYAANSTVSLGNNGDTSKANYMIIVKASSGTPTPTPTSTPTPTPTQPPSGSARYLTVSGAGSKDGSSWANAFEGDKIGGLQAAWDATPANGTLYVGSGTYDAEQTLNITTSNDGSGSTALKKLVGYNTGNGLPYFKGTWTPGSSDTTNLIDVSSGASYWQVQDIKVSNYYVAVGTAGKNVCYRIYNVDASYISDGLYLRGGGSKVSEADAAAKKYSTDGSHDIIIEDCDFDHYTKRGIRFRDGNYDAVVKRCTADGGGQAFWRSGNFQFSFQVADSAADDNPSTGIVFDYNIEFHDCVGNNNYTDTGASSYWNGDGFVTEGASDNIKFYSCIANDNTDGGWDCKSKRVYLYDCVAARNKRAFRLWSKEIAQLNNCIGIYSKAKGGTNTHCGVWASGPSGSPAKLELNYCTMFNNSGNEIMNDGGNAIITVNNSIIGQDNSTTDDIFNNTPTLNNCDVYIKGVKGTDPSFVNPTSTWNGVGTNWNSQTYTTTKGYYQAP